MQTETIAILQKLAAHVQSYQQWRAPLVQYFRENLPRVNVDCTLEQFERGRQEIEARLLGQQDPYPPINALLQRLCGCYIDGDDAQREAIRQQVAAQHDLEGLIPQFVYQAAEEINAPADAHKLKLGLAAVSIENCSSDYRDTLTMLATLFQQAERAGFDPRPIFTTASWWSTDSPTTGGCDSLANTMRNLESNAILGRRGRHS